MIQRCRFCKVTLFEDTVEYSVWSHQSWGILDLFFTFQPFACSLLRAELLLQLLFSGQEDDEDEKENDKDEEDFDEQPAIVGDGLKVLKDFRMGKVHIELSVFYVSVNPVLRRIKY